MDEREILTRFKDGTLDRRQAVALLAPSIAGLGTAAPGLPDHLATPVTSAASVVPVAPVAPVTSGTQVTPYAPPARELPGRAAPVAVVGMAGRYPGAPDLAAYWHLLRAGRDTAAAPPPGRPGTEPGHYLERVGEFDAEFFGLDPQEAALTDPRERLLLETAWEAFEDGGCTGSRLDALRAPDGTPRNVGVFVGAGAGDWPMLAAEAGAASRGGHWDIANGVSRVLGLTGPSQCVDTAEASVPTAVHLALASLERGECAAALVGGVHLLLHPWSRRPGAGGAGAAGEGVGALLLKPLDRALADGDTVHAVVRGSAASHARDGVALAAALARAGAGSEAETALRETALRATDLRETAPCARPSVGECGPATGLALLTRAVLQLRHGVLVPAPGREVAAPWNRPEPSDAADAAGASAASAAADPSNRLAPSVPRRAVVGLRGAGGVDAQVVLEEYAGEHPDQAPQARDRAAGRGELVLVSGPTPAHAQATARRLGEWLRAGYEVPGLAAVARGLRTGRAAMDCRLAFVVHGVEELVRVLEESEAPCADLRGGHRDPMGLGRAPETAGYLAALWHGGRLGQLRDLWLAGVDVDWAALEAAPGAGAVSVPIPPSALLRSALWLPAR
ncbi:polyketide synthase (plasmid) [Streptomyces sp. NBC_01351]|uniref:beta-ketoacyl [acyl carrier protein] synthase domain-containing protein n=1 Tax=Streptomyces sp. NBC_01351 TaxID=2903833 RepID=UPI002E314F3D|nr:polyketide synthase [Streptomyces sp. NBC_01351]